MPQWLIAGLQIVGALAAFLVALAGIMKSPVGKVIVWVWRRLFHEPVTEWLHRTTSAAIQPALVEVRQEVGALRVENTKQHKQVAGARVRMEKRLGAKIDAGFAAHLITGHPKVKP